MEHIPTEMDHQRFAGACEAIQTNHVRYNIGTLSEKTTHAVLKRYYEPLGEMHEYRVGRYVADIVNENGITEIQTASFRNLVPKLTAFLAVTHVTVVCPIMRRKYVCYIDPSSGEMLSRNRSPKTGIPLDACWELWNIRQFLLQPSLTIRLVLLDCDEYKLRNGTGRWKKHGASWLDRIPTALCAEYTLDTLNDYLALLPPKEQLPSPFCVKDFAGLLHRSVDRSRAMLWLYQTLGGIVPCGKQGNRLLYKQVDPENDPPVQNGGLMS